MPLLRPMWCFDPDGQVSTRVGALKLIVRKSEQYARYVILHSPVGTANKENILSSGTEPNVQAAIEAAERAATRIGFIFTARRRSGISTGW
jgi:hypothetical protein